MESAKSETKGAVIVRNRDVLGGCPVFRGTRAQAEILFESLAEGHTCDETVENFPTLDRDDLRQALMDGCAALMQSAPETTPVPEAGRRHARVP